VLTRQKLLTEELQPLALIISLHLLKLPKTSKMEVYHSECLTLSLSLSQDKQAFFRTFFTWLKPGSSATAAGA